jgi:penicillin amidase
MKISVWKWFAAVIALPLFITAGGGAWLWQSTQPVLSGELAVEGLRAEVVIEREPYGVAHIRAGSDRDLFFAQGFVHAGDRLWQMEFQRRVGAGRLAELLGPDALDQDRYLRTWGFYRAAQSAYAALGTEARTMVDAYAAGINAYLTSDQPLPPELRLLRHDPGPWSGADVLVWAKMMAYNLADNRRSELRRYRLLARGLSPERIAVLMPLYPGESVPDSAETPLQSARPGGETPAGLLAMDALTRRHLPRASNNWVVSGTRSKSRMPLLANDVHLGMQLPATWHLMHLQSPGLDVIGATMPGLPLVAIGRNAHIAWGVTNLAADVEDLYLVEERTGGGYLYEGETRRFEIREEVIRVKGADPVIQRIRRTAQGPVISDVVERPKGAPLIALRWVGHDGDDTTLEAFLGVNRATGWEEFRKALARYVAPGQNFVYADRDGRIGYSASGRLPKRVPGHSGLYPVPADGSWDWQGYLPFSDLPARLDPTPGYLVTANQRITEPGYPHRLSLEWGAEPYRAARISELIEARPKHDLGTMADLQRDTVTLLYRDLRPVIEAMNPLSANARRWRLRLLAWNGNASLESVESSVFHAWYTALSTLPEQETGERWWYRYPRYLVSAMREGDIACERRGATCPELAAQALEQALERLGPEPHAWGELHRADLAHSLLTHTFLAPLTDRHPPMGGSHHTVNVGWFRPESFAMHHGPTYRQLIDMADPESSLFVLAGGQSANWLTDGYADQLPLWQRGDYLPMRREGYPVKHRLILRPR